MSKQRYIYHPVGVDLFDSRVPIEDGTVVVKVQPFGCPRNGTMKHCYVGDSTTGKLFGLILENSLVQEK